MGYIKALIIEDNEDDFLLIQRQMKKSNIEISFKRVWLLDDVKAELLNEEWDIIISDYNLPDFTAVNLLELIRLAKVETPIILLSGIVGEELAVELMRMGASDFVMKGNLARLPEAIRRELRDSQVREERKKDKEEKEDLFLKIKQKNEELEIKNAELERFSYTVSHDLKSPLITIMGFAEMAEIDLESGDNQKVNSDLLRIKKSAQRMNKLLIDLLKFSKIGFVEEVRELVHLSDVIEEAKGLLGMQILHSGAIISYGDDLPQVEMNKSILVEIFQNLIENSIKYKKDDLTPLIEIGMSESQFGKAVYVKDNGMGIEKEYREKVFALFEKLNPSSDGSGAGLAIVKRIVELYGGKVWLFCDGFGKGSTFYLTLPFANT